MGTGGVSRLDRGDFDFNTQRHLAINAGACEGWSARTERTLRRCSMLGAEGHCPPMVALYCKQHSFSTMPQGRHSMPPCTRPASPTSLPSHTYKCLNARPMYMYLMGSSANSMRRHLNACTSDMPKLARCFALCTADCSNYRTFTLTGDRCRTQLSGDRCTTPGC